MALWIRGASQVIRVSQGDAVKTKEEMNDLCVLDDKVGSSIVIKNGRIVFVGADRDARAQFCDTQFEQIIDAQGLSVIPGLIDAHTHPVWDGDRVHEFGLKLGGSSYLEVHQQGGGIHYTVEKTRLASEDDLLKSLNLRLNLMSQAGTTLVECKSGYGLDKDTELKMLRVLETAKSRKDISISSTFCGAHAVPRGSTPAEATDDVISIQLPALKEAIDNGDVSVDNIDVFCETGVFEVAESRRILEEGRRIGLKLNFHAEELSRIGGAEMGAALKAEAMSHLEEISDEGILAMAESGSVAVLLPTTAFFLRLPSPPAKKMIAAGVPVALGTDFNPNAFCLSMPLTMYLACVLFRMSPAEALVAATINAARSLRVERERGSIEVGKKGDLVLVKAKRWEHLIYQVGNHRDVIAYVIHNGNVVISNQ